VLDTVGKPLARRGVQALFCGVPTFSGKVMDFKVFTSYKHLKITFIYFLVVATAHGTLVPLKLGMDRGNTIEYTIL